MTILSPAAIATTIFPPPPHAYPKSPTLCFSFNPTLPFLLPRFKPNARSRHIHSALSPQQPDPPPGNDTGRPKGITATLSTFQDRVQIFFAVLFWMSLFFWASASDRNNNGSGRPNKGSPFRR